MAGSDTDSWRYRHVGRAIVVPLFTFAATITFRRKTRVVLSHGDCFKGDAMIIHAVNAGNIAQKPQGWRLALDAQSLHFWVMLRDRWIIRGLRYRTYVAVSSRVATELQQYFGVPKIVSALFRMGLIRRCFTQTGAARPSGRISEFRRRKVAVVRWQRIRPQGALPMRSVRWSTSTDVWLLGGCSDNPLLPGSSRKMRRDRLIFAGPRLDVAGFLCGVRCLCLADGL